ncbi:MAG: glucose-6-phosphate dehydrogenase, partial [Dehalococcoidia bacterium]
SSGLAREDNGWRRLLVEKPFGQDESSAHALDETIRDAFREDQVFRIDHFLGKETVQNLLAFRFANTIFEPLWSRNYIDHVQITVAESVDVGTRGAFYEQSGVVRDMVQNHLVQLLCMVAMEPPSLANPNADAVRGKKVEVLEAVRRWTPKEFQANSVAGQYQGYRDTANVAEDSNVATYAALRLYIDNWRWQGVPFYLRTGKAMGTRVSEIVVQFKQPPLAIFPASDGGSPSPNALSICVSPDEGIHLRMEAKIPGEGTKTQSVDMEFHYADAFAGNDIPEPYERLLEDALAGDCGLFIRSDQIRQAWNILDPLIKCWEGSEPHTYRRGTWGPAKADELLAESGHQWLTLCHHD